MTARRRRELARPAILAAAIVLAVAWGGFLGLRHLDGAASPLDRLEAVTLDWRHQIRGPRPPPEAVVVVAIDDRAIERTGAFPIPRKMLAKAVTALVDAGVRVVAMDLLFLAPGADGSDAVLAAALSRAPAVVAAALVFPGDGGEGRAIPPTAFDRRMPQAADVRWPVSPIARAGEVAAVNMATDGGGTPRHVPLLFAAGETIVPAFPLAAAGFYGGETRLTAAGTVTIDGIAQPLDLGHHLALAFYGPAGTVPSVSLADVLDGRIAPDRLEGRIAVIGVTALAAGDTFATPFGPVMPGVEVMATAVGNLLTGAGLDRSRRVRAIDAATAIALPVVAILVLGWRRTLAAYGVVAGLFLAWFAACEIAFGAGTWLSATLPVAAAAPPVAAFVIAETLRERRAAAALARARDALAGLHSPALADRLSRDPGYLAAPAVQPGAVLFFDLAGFTGLTERIGGERTRAFQNALMERVEAAVVPHRGELMAFLGDGAMIVFGLPDPAPDDARDALLALAALRTAISGLVAAEAAALGEAPGARYGLAFGPLVLSRVGTARQATVTVTGDTVNVASRLMEIARAEGAQAAVAEAVFAALPAREAAARAEAFSAPREVAVRGRREPLPVRFG